MDQETFDRWLARAWDEHAAEPGGAAAVAARIDEGRRLAADAAELKRLAHLAHHLWGEHLGDWAAGLRWLLALADEPAFGGKPAAAAALAPYTASLSVTGGHDDAALSLPLPERIQATALAATNVAARDAARADVLLRRAVADAATPGLPGQGPHLRALAVAGNNIAATLEEKALLSNDERALMLLGAQTARTHWALAGGWLETERAEYRLALSQLKAGDAAQARRHAQACLEAVQAHAAPPLEHFFGWQAMALAAKALLDVDGHAKALAQARQAFDALDAADQAWCRASLDRIDFGRG